MIRNSEILNFKATLKAPDAELNTDEITIAMKTIGSAVLWILDSF